MRRWIALRWGASRLFDLVALVIYADPRPPSPLALPPPGGAGRWGGLRG